MRSLRKSYQVNVDKPKRNWYLFQTSVLETSVIFEGGENVECGDQISGWQLLHGHRPRPACALQLAAEGHRGMGLSLTPNNLILLPDGRILGRWTQKWPSKITCGPGNQRPRKRPNSKFPTCRLILTIGKNWPNNLYTKIVNTLLQMLWGDVGLAA